MDESNSKNNRNEETTNIRESLILTAVNFLTNPNVKRCTIAQKQKFLRNKGLTDQEIEIASNRAGLFVSNGAEKNINTHTIINMDRRHSSLILQPKSNYLSVFFKIMETFKSFALISSVLFAIYTFYQKVIKSFIFGERSSKTIEQKFDELSVKVENDLLIIHKEISEIKQCLSKNCQTQFVKQEIQALQQDLDKIRGLLLNKKQFASSTLPSMVPSIPQWQLDSRRTDDCDDKNEDANSGSGSSEAENVTKNSDSSLEIM